MSQEAVQMQRVDFPIDMWASGVVLYQMVSGGQLPFNATYKGEL